MEGAGEATEALPVLLAGGVEVPEEDQLIPGLGGLADYRSQLPQLLSPSAVLIEAADLVQCFHQPPPA